ncbi:UNVERIFIED_CONTAM: hypothetical protein RMT77_008015 [Armadillidium vulgare]
MKKEATMRWMRVLTFISNASFKICFIVTLWFTASLFFHSKFTHFFSASSRVVYVESEKNVKVELPQNFNIEINPTTTDVQTEKFERVKIMIMSSMPRSGSTLLGELLSNYSRETKYYFEPDQYLEKNLCLKNDSCTVRFFNDLLSCKGNKTFHDWFKKKRFFFKFYDSKAKRCNNETDYKTCVDEIDLNDDCRNSGLLLIKNIRTRLKIVRDVLRTNKDLKIIHLIRDPRGSLWSIKRFKWGVSEESRCKDFADDLKAFNGLKKRFPQRIINVSYELFSKEPLRETKRIFKFLFNLNDIPEVTANFLKEHLSPEADVTGVMSTFKNATSQYQLWRRKISDDYLKKIENISDCREGILGMNHNLFNKVSKARNEKFSLFKN